MEWTGLTDKRGVPICVGDLVRTDYGVVNQVYKLDIAGISERYTIAEPEQEPGQIWHHLPFKNNPNLENELEVIKRAPVT
jgi:hypothetical protein